MSIHKARDGGREWQKTMQGKGFFADTFTLTITL